MAAAIRKAIDFLTSRRANPNRFRINFARQKGFVQSTLENVGLHKEERGIDEARLCDGRNPFDLLRVGTTRSVIMFCRRTILLSVI